MAHTFGEPPALRELADSLSDPATADVYEYFMKRDVRFRP